MVAKEGLVDGPGLGEQGSGMCHLQRGEQREQSGTPSTLKKKKKQKKRKIMNVFEL